MIQRTLSGSGIAQAEVTSYSWDLAGRLLSHSTNAGGQPHATSYQYDTAGRLAARKVQAGSQTDLITQRYGYDAVERLAQIKYLKAEGTAGEQVIEQLDYSYDAAGRRTSKTALNNNGIGQGETPMTATYDAANRMTAITLTVGAASQTYALSYDAAGNLTQKQNTVDATDKTSYTWDASNRLSQIAQTGATTANTLNASFTYDAFGRRIQSSIAQGGNPAQTVQYLYEGQQALGEIRNGQLSHRLLTGLSLDETIARIAIASNGQKDAANNRIFMTDALNSVIAQLSDDNAAPGSIQNSYGYSPYGEAVTVGPDATKNPVQYTSRENDGTGLMFYRARYYDSVLKRFISSDPIGLAGGLNMFAYVEGDPVSLTDPTGEFPAFLGGALLGAGMDIAIQMMTNDMKFQCIKWDVVLIAATAGAVNPFSSLNALNSAAKAQRQWARAAGLRNGSRAAKRTAQRGDKHNQRSWKEGASWAAIEGGAEGIGSLIPDEKHWRICEPCECK